MSTGPFLDYLRYERNYSERTIVEYGRDIAQFEDFLQEKAVLFIPAEISSDDVREWVIHLMDGGASPNSVNRRLSALRTFYKFLLKRGEVLTDPTRKVTGPKRKKPLPYFVREKEMDQLLDEVDFGEGFAACRDRLIIRTFYETGMRLSELIGLNDGDADFSASQFKVTGKRNKQRLIPFGDGLKQFLQEYVSLRNSEIIKADGAFFVKENGARVTKGLVYRIVKQNLSKVVTIKKRSPHVLRHTFATTMLNHDAELGAVKDLLGHSSLAATEIYTHTTFEELKKVYNQAHPRA